MQASAAAAIAQVDPAEDCECLVQMAAGSGEPEAEPHTLLDGDRHGGPEQDRPEVAKLEWLDRQHSDGQHDDCSARGGQAAHRMTGDQV